MGVSGYTNFIYKVRDCQRQLNIDGKEGMQKTFEYY
jgi:hypothetical protein